jgi:hypothetical protein
MHVKKSNAGIKSKECCKMFVAFNERILWLKILSCSIIFSEKPAWLWQNVFWLTINIFTSSVKDYVLVDINFRTLLNWFLSVCLPHLLIQIFHYLTFLLNLKLSLVHIFFPSWDIFLDQNLEKNHIACFQWTFVSINLLNKRRANYLVEIDPLPLVREAHHDSLMRKKDR